MIWTIVITALVTVLAVVLAMNFATPEKKLERKIEHRYNVADPQFRRELGVMLGPGIVPGNRITDLQNGHEIFPAMLAAVAAAQKTITFETYIYWSGEIGQKMADALSERARAGVKVNVMIDWAGSIKMEDALLEQMETAGVVVHRYRPLHWYNLGRLNNRTHRKLLVVDGRVGFTGGVGIADQWTGEAQDPDHWRDMHFRIEGPVVAQIQAAFNDNWIKTTGEVLNGVDYFPPLQPVGDDRCASFHQLARRRQRKHAPDVPDVHRRRRTQHRPGGVVLRPRRADHQGLAGGAPARGAGSHRGAGRAHRFGDRPHRVQARVGRTAAGRASKSTNTNPPCCTTSC